MKVVNKQKRYFSLLSQSFLFKGIDSPTVQTAFSSEDCQCMEFEAGEKVYTKNHFQKSVGLVVTGQLKAVKPEQDGTSVTLNTFFPGGVFGVASLFNNARQYVSEVVAVRQSRVLFLPQQLLHRLFEQNLMVAENYIGYLSGRICFLNSRIDSFIGGNVEARLSAFLLNLSAQSENPLELILPCSLSGLSNTLDMGRASLYRAFDTLIEANIICRSGRKITIVDLTRLRTGQFNE